MFNFIALLLTLPTTLSLNATSSFFDNLFLDLVFNMPF